MRRRFLLTAAVTAILFATTMPVAAQTLTQVVPSDCNVPGGCQSICDIATLAQNILNDAIFIAVFMAAILFAWAGWKFLTAAGGGQVSSARSIATNTLIGFLLILGAWVIVDTIMRMLLGASVLPWYQIC